MQIKEINPKNIRNFVEGNAVHYKIRTAPIHEVEQAQYRASLCPECVEAKKCVVCGCPTPNMFKAPHKTCSKGRWGEMISQEDWEKAKIILNWKPDESRMV